MQTSVITLIQLVMRYESYVDHKARLEHAYVHTHAMSIKTLSTFYVANSKTPENSLYATDLSFHRYELKAISAKH